MHDNDIPCEICFKRTYQLPGQRDFRHQDDDLPLLLTHKLRSLDIDLCLAAASDSMQQKSRLLQDADYVDTYNELQSIVQSELLNLVKGRIESTERGKELLSKQLKIVKRLKTKIIDDTNREMELFKKFKEYSKEHPNASYEEFIKENI